jgi:molecular chaperone GrpE
MRIEHEADHHDDGTEAEGALDEAGGAEAPDGEALEPDDALARELAELQDRHLRLAAEFENYRKRTREDMYSAGVRGQAALVGSLLDALDDFERVHGVDPEHATIASIIEGMQLVERKLNRVLAEAGLEVLDPEGAVFDPETMEAVLRVPVEDPGLDDTVEQVFQRGVVFKGHLVRPARVSVRKAD